MTRARSLVAALWLGACGAPSGVDGDGSDAEAGSEEDGGTGTTGDGDGDGDGESTTGEDEAQCSMYAQDCPEGEKCNWKVSGIDVVNVCVTVVGDRKIGETCDHEGVFSGADTCDADGLCYGAVSITSGWPGVCRPYCRGDEATPLCDDVDYTCSKGDLPACLPTCDPLVQDCEGGQEMCFYHEPIPGFVCANSSGTASVGDDCLVPFECQKFQTCQPGDAVVGCQGNKCCTELCDVDAANTCSAAGMGAECVSLEVPGVYENVGACLIPG